MTLPRDEIVALVHDAALAISAVPSAGVVLNGRLECPAYVAVRETLKRRGMEGLPPRMMEDLEDAAYALWVLLKDAAP